MEQEGYLRSLKTESVVQRIINSLTDGMISGELKPGDKCPQNRNLLLPLAWPVPPSGKLPRFCAI